MSLSEYHDLIARKSQLGGQFGFAPDFMHENLYPFQRHLVDWAVHQGRAAIFADCGLGKTPMQLTWAHNICRRENKPVLVIAPLSVSLQTVEEGAKFSFHVERSLNGRFKTKNDIVTTNYERLHHFDPADFAGVVCDESSIIKNFDGMRKGEITEFMKQVKYRLLCTATAAPNDYIELGTSSEALGQLGYMDMLGMFFKNDEDSLHPMASGSKWRLKPHAQRDFWRWVCSWARAVRKPSDLGFDDGPFILPALDVVEHVVDSAPREGDLFAMPSTNLEEERAERKASLEARCSEAARLLSASETGVAWCQLNAEADLLESMIPGAVQISGADDDERKEEVFEAFRHGHIKRIVTKPKIAAFGMNWQHCAHMTYFPDHSFEQYYQAVRRFWRFGQKRPVRVDTVTSQSNMGVTRNMKRKALAAEAMFADIVAQMNDALSVRRMREFDKKEVLPSWL